MTGLPRSVIVTSNALAFGDEPDGLIRRALADDIERGEPPQPVRLRERAAARGPKDPRLVSWECTLVRPIDQPGRLRPELTVATGSYQEAQFSTVGEIRDRLTRLAASRPESRAEEDISKY